MRTQENPQLISEPIAHLYKKDNDWIIQSNRAHCEGVAELAEKFAAEFGMGSWGRVMGLLHDRGKESNGFQKYIVSSSGMKPEVRSRDSKRHSYIGALIVHEYAFDEHLCWLSNAIAGHHRGLYNLSHLCKELKEKTIPQEVDCSKPTIGLDVPFQDLLTSTESSHIGRMLFSCLVDADRLDTEKFMNPEESKIREGFAGLSTLQSRLDKYRYELSQRPDTLLNQLRQEIQSYCDDAALQPPGFFELTVPTGGGKTLASIVWAIRHALHNNKKRIIIAIPFTSIIVQTAETLRNIFGRENVVEHHSAVNESDDKEADHKNSLATENWDAPIIVTTNVQLFESMFSNRPSACRKLHAICNSVVILDETQCLPLESLQPIVNAMKAYRKLFGTSFLFCTASQPVLHGVHEGRRDALFQGIEEDSITSIIPDVMHLSSRMARVKLDFDLGIKTYEQVAAEVGKHPIVLCVVNTKKAALSIFQALSFGDDHTYHLSRNMCQAHLLDTITKIKERLRAGQKTQVISTQLIEAGVDIDFPVVYRQLAGLDSILQAAGRCNREGKADQGITHVFQLNDQQRINPLGNPKYVMMDLISEVLESDWFAPETIQLYFTKLYKWINSFDTDEIEYEAKSGTECNYEVIGEKFKLIKEKEVTVIVNYGDAELLISQLKEGKLTRELFRKLGRYSVGIPSTLFQKFLKSKVIAEIHTGIFFIADKNYYDLYTGLKLDNKVS